MIFCLMLVSNLMCLILSFWTFLLSEHTYLKNYIFKIYFRESAKCKVTTKTEKKIRCACQNRDFIIGFVTNNFYFHSTPSFCIFSV